MSNVIDATVGGANSNSYTTLAEAEAYLTAKIVNESWNSLNDTDKSGLLISATRQMDLLNYLGKAATETQNLAWPRFGLLTKEGYIVQHTTIPRQVKEAQAELAYSLALGNYLLEPDNTANEFSSVSIGDLAVTYKDTPVTATSFPKTFIKLLSPWLTSINRVVRA